MHLEDFAINPNVYTRTCTIEWVLKNIFYDISTKILTFSLSVSTINIATLTEYT